MALDPTTPFVWGAGGAPMTPQAAEAQRKVAQALMTQGMDYSPIKSPWQGAARVAQALIGGYESAQADASDRKVAEMQPQMMAAALSGMFPGANAAPAQPIASGVATPAGGTTIPAGDVDPRLKDAISNVASVHPDVDPAYMTRLAMVENGGKINGGSALSSAQGPFQFLKGTAQQYGLTDPSDPTASADAAARFTEDNRAALTQALGREPTPGELYLAHQQGAGGAAKLLANPNAPVEAVIGPEAARNNGATPGMTAGQFANRWTGKFNDIVQTVDPNQKNIIDAQADSPPMAFAGTPATAGASPAAADDGEDAALPANAAPAQGALPTAQAVQAAAQPSPQASIAKIAPLISLANSPYASAATKQIAGVLLASQLSAAQKAADPMRALDMQSKQLGIKKLESDLAEKKTIVVNGRLVDAQTGETIKDYSDIGKTPEGSKLVRDSSGNVIAVQPLPGSPEDTKSKAAQQKQDQQKQQQDRYGDIVTQDIDRAIKGIDSASLPVTGAIGSMTSNIPGTQSHDVASLLSTIKANIGFDRLQQMRAASPTGGALGQVSDFENKLLQATIGNLEQSQSKGQLKQNLNRVYNTYMDIIHGPGNGPARRPLDFGTAAASSPAPAPQPGLVKGGYKFKGGNPADPNSWEKV